MENDLIRKADEILYDLTHRFRILDYINPTNRLEEKEKFLTAWKNGETYQPQFEYKKLPTSLPKIINDLQNLLFDADPVSKMFEETRDKFAALANTLQFRGTEEFSQTVVQVYGVPNPNDATEAKAYLKKNSRSNRPMEAGVRALSEILKNKIREERIDGWEINEDPLCIDLAELDSSHHKIRLQTGMLFTKKAMRRLRSRLIHVQLYRCLNGERQPYKMFGVGLAGSYASDEALAMDHEEKFSLLDPETARYYVGKRLACALALRHSFRGVFSRLENYFDLETAYGLTESVKRGLVDTAQTGAWIRDHACFIEQKKISNLSTDDLQVLYTGRFPVHHLNTVKEMIAKEWLLPPAFLPKTFSN